MVVIETAAAGRGMSKKKTMLLYSLGAKYSIDGRRIFELRFGADGAYAKRTPLPRGRGSGDRAAIFRENSINVVASAINDGFTVAG